MRRLRVCFATNQYSQSPCGRTRLGLDRLVGCEIGTGIVPEENCRKNRGVVRRVCYGPSEVHRALEAPKVRVGLSQRVG